MICSFTAESWVILSPIEQSIKAKIEAIGVPLKNWDIQINYGIKTGYNEAFIISGEKRKELIEQDPKSAEIIRPILRGRDIKRYGYEFADLWLINTHNGIREKGIKPINIDDYPAIKNHLDKFYPELEKRLDKGITPYNLRNCAYIEDFSKQKIVYIEIMTDNPKEGYDFPAFSFDSMGCICLNTAYIMTGDIQELKYILAVLNSKLGKQLVKFYVTQLQNRQFRMLHQSVKNFPIPKANMEIKQQIEEALQEQDYQKIDNLVYEMYHLSEEEIHCVENQ